MEQLSLESERLVRAIPALKTLLTYPTLGAYFGDKTKDLPQTVFGVDRDLFLSVIDEEVTRLYQDSDLADQVVAQLKEFPVLENGTHLSFFKTHDTPDGDDLRARLGQNIFSIRQTSFSGGKKFYFSKQLFAWFGADFKGLF